jgi:FkbM family methyltransferase
MSLLNLMVVFGWRGLIMFFIRFFKLKTVVSASLPSDSRLVYLRLNTSDLEVYQEIFWEGIHQLAPDFSPLFIVDAGANIGISSIDFAVRYPGAKIIALEPEESNFQMLVKNAQNFANIHPVKAALWSEVTDLHISDPGLGTWGFRTNVCKVGTEVSQIVRSVTLEGIMNEHCADFVDILKLDIEGAEKEVLEHSAAWIDRVGVLVIELHDRFQKGCTAAFERASTAFTCSPTNGDKLICVRKNSPTILQ